MWSGFDPTGFLEISAGGLQKDFGDKVMQQKPHVVLWNTLSGKYGFLT